ncbi:MAG: aspartate--tRNA(Asn) ligase [Candidatus Pacebacteria bacterium]|nr:aspartate--tRNA(Asn) ligase [Candidatus Paceibacterota bacterium]MCF7857095.1 aspartate--tRNA(Asn) ligase [Candidatus Paceibacterota bacterium]
MERILIAELKNKLEQEVTIQGSVNVVRNQGKVAFFDFRDRTGIVQGVIFGKPELLESVKVLSPESTVTVVGTVHARQEKMINPNVQNGDIELEITAVTILSLAEALPFDLDADLNIDTLLDYRPLTLRRKHEKAIFKIQSEIVAAYGAFMRREGFTEFQAPKLVGGDAEGGAEVFKVDYFNDHKAYLATSPQLYKQIMVGVYERVFTFATAFRAEKSATTRHLSEYTSLDAEIGFIEDHTDIMRIETALMRYLAEHLHNTTPTELAVLGMEIPKLGDKDTPLFPHMKLREAQQLIKEKTGKDKTNEPDLEPEDERWLCEYAHNELSSDFIFITHYPVSKRPFYTYEDEDDLGFTKSFDLLFRGVEITTGGQRVHDVQTLQEKMRAKKLNPENFEFYLQIFKNGMPPHGGWGMGLERLTAKFCGVQNVKEATLFPRDINRIDTLLTKNTEHAD